MSRRIVTLAPEHVARLPGPCATCVAWECSPAEARRLAGPGRGASAASVAQRLVEEKRAWVSSVLADWGPCGHVVLDDDDVVAHVQYAPAALVPGSERFPTAPVSPDAVLLSSLRVSPGHAGHGLGRALVQRAARDLVERGGYRAVEAFGAQGPLDAGAGCVVPAGYLVAVGFAVHRDHPTTPRLRLDLRSTVRWREEIEGALDRLRGAVVRAPAGQRRPGPARSSRALRR